MYLLSFFETQNEISINQNLRYVQPSSTYNEQLNWKTKKKNQSRSNI